ncbi:uncharacterized protein LOC129568686 [Sitodiplosis mosellana]|uniref:uncharacterized protein LOC129568686 n=1 Tax=Sitodiplosis mosellana TaxID=263140 RepID=UPI00244431DC|nr:uncharacterized protein LOC129568686 [Sitodiplosis mosellana]
MNSICLFVLVGGVLFASVSASEELGKAIKICRQQFPESDTRATPDTDFIRLSKSDECYLHCILSAQKVILHGALNADSLQYASNNDVTTKIKTQCGTIRDEDECEFAAKVQKCIQNVLKTTPVV